MTQPLVVEVAINGPVGKDRNPNVPVSPEEMAASAEACLAAGATIVHAHAGVPFVGKIERHASEPYIEAFAPVLLRHPDAILYPTLPAGPHLPIPERFAHMAELADAGILRVAAIDPGTMNWGTVSPDARGDEEVIYQNTFGDVRWAFRFCAERRLGCTMSIFEPGFLQMVLAHRREGTLPRGSVVKLEFSGGYLCFGLPANAQGLDAYLSMLDDTGIPWLVNYRDGDFSDGFGRLVLERGGHVRVGIEDYGGPGQPRNEDLVAEIVGLARSMGRRPATTGETAEIIGLP
jgi:uncharacterized protein (DUF849 family)